MKILMVCLGNICRSPMAQGILENKIKKHDLDWQVDSAGTGGWHTGEKPDRRAILEAAKNKIDISHQRARKFSNSDFENFDLILAMDTENYNDLIRLATSPEHKQKVKMVMNLVHEGKNISVPDPYYDNRFSLVFDMLDEAMDNFVKQYLQHQLQVV